MEEKLDHHLYLVALICLRLIKEYIILNSMRLLSAIFSLICVNAFAISPEIIQALKTGAEQGDKEAPVLLGYYYEKGLGLKKDLVESYAWYTLAKENSDEAQRLEKDMKKDEIDAAKSRAAILTEKIRLHNALKRENEKKAAKKD